MSYCPRYARAETDERESRESGTPPLTPPRGRGIRATKGPSKPGANVNGRNEHLIASVDFGAYPRPVVASPIRCALYLRVSTRDQRLAGQFRELRAAVEARGWVIVAVYRERRSAAAGAERPQWRQLQADAARRRFGAVAAASLDRLGRSALDILAAVSGFRDRGVRLYLAREGIASDDAVGAMLLTVLAGVAQLERDLISDRTRAGLRAARARGATLGRPVERIAEHELARVRSGAISRAELGRELQVSARTIRRRLAEVVDRTQTGPRAALKPLAKTAPKPHA